MSKQHRTKLIKSLEVQLAATDDPKLKADVSRQLTKLLSKPTRKGSSRKPEAKPSSAQTSSLIVAKWADRLSHVSEKQRILTTLICEFEERQRQRGQKFTEAERNTLLQELIGSLSVEERAVLNGGSPEVA